MELTNADKMLQACYGWVAEAATKPNGAALLKGKLSWMEDSLLLHEDLLANSLRGLPLFEGCTLFDISSAMGVLHTGIAAAEALARAA